MNSNDIFLDIVLYLLENNFKFELSCDKDKKLIFLPGSEQRNFCRFGFKSGAPFTAWTKDLRRLKKTSLPTEKEILSFSEKNSYEIEPNLENIFFLVTKFVDYDSFSFYTKEFPIIKKGNYEIEFTLSGEINYYSLYLHKRQKIHPNEMMGNLYGEYVWKIPQ